jgi:DNA gyrase subunit A
VAYIERLEQALEELQAQDGDESDRAAAMEPSEPPTTINVVTITAAGLGKRTPRHLYGRQRRAGMGVFGLDTSEADPPAHLVLADESAGLVLVTNQGRAFRVPLSELAESPVHARARSLVDRFPLRSDERLALVFGDPLPGSRNAYLVLVTQRGQVRRIGSQYVGKNLQAGTVLYNVAEGGPPAAVCWTSGGDELFIVTRSGTAIRFAERLVPVRGCLGIRVDPNDSVAGVAATGVEGGVFLLTDEGKGTIRLMSGFSANKAPGSSGKTAIKADKVVGAIAAEADQDLFIISQLGKIIRFRAGEVPSKEGVVQGVNCMNLRADECVAVAASP